MTITVLDVESAYMEAEALVTEAFRGIEDEFNQPTTELALLLLASRLTPEVRENLKAMDPEAFSQFEQVIGTIQEKKTYGR